MPVPISSPALALVLVLLYSIHAVFLMALMVPRYSMKVEAAAWAAAVLISAAGGVFFRDHNDLEMAVTLAYLITALLFTVAFFLLSGDAFPKKVFLIALMMSMFTMCYVVSIFIGEAVGSRMVNAVLCVVFYLASVLVYLFVLKNPLREVTFARPGQWWGLTVIVLLFALIIAVDTLFVHHAWYFETSDIILTLAQIVLMVLVLWSVFRTIRYMEKNTEYEKEKERSRFYAYQLSEMRKDEENARRLRHDQRHHDRVIAEYARSGNLEGLLRYLDLREQEEERQSLRRYCDDDTVNSILSAFAAQAREAGVDMTISALVGRDLAVDPLTLVAVLGNVLENALHGCRDSGREAPRIDLRVSEKSGKLVVACENTCADHIPFDENGLPRNDKRRGLGVDSILSAARHYDGSVAFSAEDNLFSCLVILNLK